MFDDVFFTHAVLWFFVVVSAVATVGLIAALFSMGRAGNRKD